MQNIDIGFNLADGLLTGASVVDFAASFPNGVLSVPLDGLPDAIDLDFTDFALDIHVEAAIEILGIELGAAIDISRPDVRFAGWCSPAAFVWYRSVDRFILLEWPHSRGPDPAEGRRARGFTRYPGHPVSAGDRYDGPVAHLDVRRGSI